MDEIKRTSAEDKGIACALCGSELFTCVECDDDLHSGNIIYCQYQGSKNNHKHWCEKCGKERLNK